ncbi:MAG: formylglycine-generating enzyme family protein [Verrucomicrobia bacterium]|nr:formylglycine-generating enzyme family protein [Verrucomicrobiota bacterium]
MPANSCASVPRTRFFRDWLTMGISLAIAFSASGAEEIPSAPDASLKALPQKNSLGQIFLEVPGTPVFFSVYETRVSDWAVFLADTSYNWSYKPHFPQSGDHPVVNVNIRDAIKFCEWLTAKERASGLLTQLQSYRLPTNREWDVAAGILSQDTERATSQKLIDEQTFPWGLEWPPPSHAGNFNSSEINGGDDGFAYTAPVGSYTASKDGLHDLAGNVWEWVCDPDENEIRAKLRGGSWVYFRKEYLLSSYQYDVPLDLHAPSIGFRIVLEDKHRTNIFLTQQNQIKKELARKRREEVMLRPAVNAAEIEEMRKIFTARPDAPVDVPALPDSKTLKPAAPGSNYTNTLGMTLRPAGNDQVLFSTCETRVHDYQTFLIATQRQWNRKPSFNIKPTHPIMNITWAEAMTFCEWLTNNERTLRLIPRQAIYRLPTDLEWSTAVGLPTENGNDPSARHLDNKTDFPWGLQPVPPPGSGNFDSENMSGYQDNYPHTAPVGSFSPNAFGLFDMAGNVAEWCMDTWPGSKNEHVIRGSSYLSSTRNTLLSSARLHGAETAARTNVGFRCVLDLQPH